MRRSVWTLIVLLLLAAPSVALESPRLSSSQPGVKPLSGADILAAMDRFCKTGELNALYLPQSRHNVPFPDDMLREHILWHECGGRRVSLGKKGAGKEFLDWHHDFIRRYMAWRKTKGLPPISPWKELPGRLVAADTFDPAKIIRYSSLDEMGRAIEGSIHGTMHSSLAREYKDSALSNPMSAPRSFYFWKMHGLIDVWRQAWVDTCSGKKLRCGPENLKSSSSKNTAPGERKGGR